MLTAPGSARARTGLLVLGLGAGLSACASLTPESPASTRWAGAPIPHAPSGAAAGPRYKLGAPYQAGGVWYVPAEQPNYDEVGTASWYGDAFNGKPTANGEVFDMHLASAAHATLPMPCMVEVTNLENGKVLLVRMNDRGPFHPGRIIDLSRAAATELGFSAKGTAKVRVRYAGPAPLDGAAATSPSRQTVPAPQALPTYQIAAPAISAGRTPAATVEGGYLVQAGAFASRETADRVAQRLAGAGRAEVRPLDRGGARLWRVVVGPSSDNETARATLGRVAALGFGAARVVSAS